MFNTNYRLEFSDKRIYFKPNDLNGSTLSNYKEFNFVLSVRYL